jgi:ABC-type sugar transport system permease subunit
MSLSPIEPRSPEAASAAPGGAVALPGSGPRGGSVAGGGRRRLLRPGEGLGYVLTAPAVLALLAVTAYPLFSNLWASFHYDNKLDPITGTPWVGLDNYRKVFSSQADLLPALEHTLIYTAVAVTFEVVVGLGIALLLARPMRGVGLFRTLILLPWAVPTVVAATVWKTMFDERSGAVNYLLGLAHLPGADTSWFTGTLSSWTAILMADAWQSIPFVAILLLAGLQGIPRDIYEAAHVDGAGPVRVFFSITLPMLRPTLMVVLIFRTLSSFLIFDLIYAMTGGGPGTATATVSYLNWRAFLVNSDFGLGGAISIVMVVVALLIAALYKITMKPATE